MKRETVPKLPVFDLITRTHIATVVEETKLAFNLASFSTQFQ